MFTEIKPLLDWLSANPHWAGVATFTVAFLESLAIVGLFIPGIVIMTAIGSLVGTGYLPLVGTLLWAMGGAIAGDVLSFSLGYHYKEGVRNLWPLNRYPGLLQRGESFFQKHGGKSVFIGRFAGPVRPILPLIAGMMTMSPSRFLIADILSSIPWALFYLLPGVLLGAASQTLAPETATRLIIFVIVALLVLWCVSWLLQRSYQLLNVTLNSLFADWWQVIRKHPRHKLTHYLLADPSQPHSHRQLALTFLALVLSIAFCVLAYSVYTHGVLTNFNLPVYHWMRSLRNPTADHFFIPITLLSSGVLAPMWLAVFAWLGYRKNWWAALHWLALGLLCMAGTGLIKYLIHSPRPVGLLQTPKGWSFPSGHTTAAVSFFGFFAVLLTRDATTTKRWLIFSGAILLAGAILFSRVYLTAHWLTDVIGGILFGLICIIVVTLSYRRKTTASIDTTGVLIVALIALVLSWGWAFHHQYNQAVVNYTPYWQTGTINSEAWWQQTKQDMPLYRTNHFGKPVDVLNIQWAGDLSEIEQHLTQQGWYHLSNPSIILAINSLTDKSDKKQPYLFAQLYQDRKPVLVMAKIIPLAQSTELLVLRLWNSHSTLDDGQLLWLGKVSYYRPWHTRFLKPKTMEAPIPAPTTVLTNDLKDFSWKRIPYPLPPIKQISAPWSAFSIFMKNEHDEDGFIVLIK